MVQILNCAAALLILFARPASAAAPPAGRCESFSAAAVGDPEAYWNTAYIVPEYDGGHTLLISTSNPTALEAAVTTMLWKAGGSKMGASDPMRSWAQPRGVVNRQFMIPSQLLGCSYRGTWEIAPGMLTGVLKKLFDTNAVELYSRQPNKLSFDRAEAVRKLAMLDRERPVLVASGTAIPSILGLADAERHSLRALLDRHEAFKRTAQLDVCIKRE